MRLPLHTTPALLSSIQSHNATSATKPPPLAFLDDEPFLIELQGSLELPGGHGEGAEHEMRGLDVGKIDFTEPVSRLDSVRCGRTVGPRVESNSG